MGWNSLSIYNEKDMHRDSQSIYGVYFDDNYVDNYGRNNDNNDILISTITP